MKKQKKNTRKKVNQPLWTRIPLVRVWRDIENYRSWIHTIQDEEFDVNSKYNQFRIKHNKFYVLYLPVSLPENDAQLPENIKRLRLMEILTPVHQYLDEDLGFAGNIIPEFSQFYDDEENPTLTYGAIYRFAFDRLNIQYVITRLLFLSAATWAFFHFNVWDLIKGVF